MKLQFKHQKFQADAAKAVVDVFAGQPHRSSSHLIDQGMLRKGELEYFAGQSLNDQHTIGWGNYPILPELTDAIILKQLQKVQLDNLLIPSEKLEGRYNLTIEMETGVGKTYTYIKTMYELNKHYGWSKFIVVVPSVAIREGVYKTFQVTQEHFAEEYGKKVRFFIYNSSQLTLIDQFASDSSISVMIINSQAFNRSFSEVEGGKKANKDQLIIFQRRDDFRSRRPIDVIAKTNPILIIDEPQSVEGKQTKKNLQQFNPLMTLRYSATHKSDSIYNMVYRLDAMEAYNKRLVKKIEVKGVTESGSTATDGYLYLQSINLSKADPTATIEFDYKGAGGIRRVIRTLKEGDNLYAKSNEMEEYHNNYVIKRIDGRDDSVEFLNGKKIYVGSAVGKVSEDQLRRIQIRETITTHIERERQLFKKGIKVLSLFFIDEVAHYKQYDASGQPQNGLFAQMFEEEYKSVVTNLQIAYGDEDYMAYLDAIKACDTHAGYFSIDKKGQMTNSKIGDKKERTSDDIDAYDLIMKNKELLLDRDPKRSPVRFIFSHSALREGWDNPNVFQICTLKQSGSDVRKRQEVGRGLRLCVNQDGDRMDVNALGNDVHNVNVLTVIASESYDSFCKGLQSELASAVGDRPIAVDVNLFVGKVITDENGNSQVIDKKLANAIFNNMVKNDYVDDDGCLTQKYYEARDAKAIVVADKVAEYAQSVIAIINSVFDPKSIKIGNPRENNVELHLDNDKLKKPEFMELWNRISAKSIYIVDFDTDELVQKSIAVLNKKLKVTEISFKVETGSMTQIDSKVALAQGQAFSKGRIQNNVGGQKIAVNSGVKYDLIGKLVEETGLTRKAIVSILTGIEKPVFDLFKKNPEEFILRAASLINDEKATVIVQHITYNLLDDHYTTDVFTEPTMKGRLGKNAMKAERHLYDHIIYDSEKEQEFATQLDVDDAVSVYVKLPDGFYINTPVGHYNPDWAVAFKKGSVKHIYFVAETKGSMRTMDLRAVEKAKIECARVHFQAISSANVVYDVIDGYQSLLTLVNS